MTTFTQIQIILDRLINGEEIRMHGPFWRGKTRDEFVALSVMGLPIIVVGDPAGSNLVKALRGNAPFGRDLQPRPVGARINRMPSRRPPASKEDIEYIEKWITAGCPDGGPDVSDRLALDATDDKLDVRYWREFDDFFLYKSSEETNRHVFGFIGNSVPVWLDFALQSTDLKLWTGHLKTPSVREDVDYILKHHIRLIELFYGSPPPAARIFTSYWRFGGNLLPDDPDSSGSPRHTMNSPADWFNWSPFLDAILRMDNLNAGNLLLARAWQIGLVADGLLRTDKDRPPNDRVIISDFQANDPALFDAVVARYGQADANDMLDEFVRRVRESGVLGA
jgi:hypothetical protein